MKKMPGRLVGDIALRYAKDSPTKFYPTGIRELDTFTGGLPSGEMTIIAARPGDGKTAMAMQFLEHVVKYSREPAGFFSIEMNGRSLVTRMIIARTGLPSVALRKGELTERQTKARDVALTEIKAIPIYIDDSSIGTISHVQEVAEAWVQGGVRFLALDYVQLMYPSLANPADTRANFVGECARALKQIAKVHDVPFLVLSQLNRESEKSRNPPAAANLKDSGDLEQVADNIILIHPDEEQPPYVDLLLVKWRNGPTGVVTVNFDSGRTVFKSVEREE